MVPLFIDNDFTEVVIEGVRRRYEHVDLIRAREVGLRRAQDELLLEWAAANRRVTISHDKKTMTAAANARMRAEIFMPGLIIVPQSLEYRIAIEDIAMIALCSEPIEWVGRVAYLPLVK